MAEREDLAEQERRWADLNLLRDEYADFTTFLIDVMEDFMGFECSDIQIDIGDWIANGPQYRMVQAQRGQAKTTITAAYAVWRLIHEPWTRVLIISAGSDMATEIANWVIQIIQGMDVLACLRPDRSAGDRASVTAYDVHYTLKGPEKSASVTCIGITSNMQGKRADLLIADDIESAKNSQTAIQRARIHHLTLDFTSICALGDIIWLGTPQSVESIYNTLPGRGTHIRVWPGRYPTPKELPDYDGFLAPMILSRLMADPSLQSGGGPLGDRGKAVDTVYLKEDVLIKKELDQGKAYFQLQHMLSTKLADNDRYPLKLSNVRFCGFDIEERTVPMNMMFVRTEENSIPLPEGIMLKDKMYRVQEASDFAKLSGLHMYVDPTGGGSNGDELAYAITGMLAGRVFLLAVGGRPGGWTDDVYDWLTDIAIKWTPQCISIEKNYGNGAFAAAWLPRLKKAADAAKVKWPGIDEVWETGQKELRIIDVLEPVIGSGKFVVYDGVIDTDWKQCQRYPAEKRSVYSFLHQLARITRDKDSLMHDDRLDAVAGSVRYWTDALSIDDQKAVAAAKTEAYRQMMQNPLGNGRAMPGLSDRFTGSMNALNKHGLGDVGHFRR